MRAVLKGLHTSRKLLASGETRTYYYAWKGGPAMKEQPGTPAFTAEYHEHRRKLKMPDENTVASLIARFKEIELPQKGKATQRDYLRYVKMIEEDFGTLPIAAVEERGSRALFEDWRQKMAATPRKADMAWTVLQRIFSLAVKSERLMRNPCEAGGRLAESGTRREIIWTPAATAKFKETAPAHIYDVFLMAMWTGQRQGDLLRLTWSAYDGKHIRLKQSKTKRNVTVKVAKDLKLVLDRKRAALAGKEIAALSILTTKRGDQWTSDGFRASWAKALSEAKITGLTFHDLRGTFVTNARKAGSSIEDIASASGHSIADVRSVLEQHYLADDNTASDGVILRLEMGKKENKTSNHFKPGGGS